MMIAVLPTSTQIKQVRIAIRDSYDTVSKKDEWTELYNAQQLLKAYGLDPNKTNSKIGKKATAHLLDSEGIREESDDHTPINTYPPIIPPECTLHFSFNADLTKYMALAPPLNLSERFENIDKMRNIFDVRLYSSKLIVNISGTDHEFWVKSIKQSGTAFVRAFGVQVSQYIMRYRPVIYIVLDDVIVELSGTNVGVGFCNLSENNKGVTGHQMIQLHPESMDQVTVSFYAKKGTSTHIHDVSLKVITFQQKNNRMIQKTPDPLVLFDGKEYLHCQGTIYPLAPTYETNYMPMEPMDHFNDSHSNESPSSHSTASLLPNIDSPAPPSLNIDDGNSIISSNWAPAPSSRVFQDMHGFGDPGNGIHRRCRDSTYRRPALQQRNEEHIQRLRSGCYVNRIPKQNSFSNIPKFQF